MIAAFKRSLQAAGGIQAVQQAAVVALPALCRAKRQKLDPSELAEVLALYGGGLRVHRRIPPLQRPQPAVTDLCAGPAELTIRFYSQGTAALGALVVTHQCALALLSDMLRTQLLLRGQVGCCAAAH